MLLSSCLACWSRPCTACSTLLTGPGPHLIRLMLAQPDQSAPLLWSTPVRLAFAFCYNDLSPSPRPSFVAVTTTEVGRQCSRIPSRLATSQQAQILTSQPCPVLFLNIWLAVWREETQTYKSGFRHQQHKAVQPSSQPLSTTLDLPIRAPICNTYHTHWPD